MRAITVVAALLLTLAGSVTGCTPAAPTPPADAVTFRTHPDPMVGGYCSYFVEDQPGKPCLDGIQQVFAAYPDLNKGGDSSRLIEITAKVLETVDQRSNSANPPQTISVSVWVIEKVYSAKAVN
ncbi:MAG: hypothetical protein CVT62_12690 [Actinobacteria bacterium HGW-Actinobacteria-2]|nr:MAG: hypothetical protein CVT62_12690 [Actinobacteria bacterium HGW-Actinobacteria-2]